MDGKKSVRSWGGARAGAGRKRIAPRPGVPHREREHFDVPLPIHVTLRMADKVYNLRSQRSLNALMRAFRGGADRFGTRLIHYSVQGNHIHLVIEAPDTASMYQAMKGLNVRIAFQMNAMMNRKGQVIAQRYHTNVLRTTAAVRNVLRYVRLNQHHHMKQAGEELSEAWVDPFTSWANVLPLPTARSKLLRSVGS